VSESDVAAFWTECVAHTGVEGPYEAWAFGDDSRPELATELALLVRDGPKRATAGLAAEYEEENEPLPEPGDLSVILDGAGAPVCVIRTSDVQIKRFGDVDDAFAWDEGEGDRSLSYWKDAHIRFFAHFGVAIDGDTRMMLERFELVWPKTV
jgi:uncharacterized protein YhfF